MKRLLFFLAFTFAIFFPGKSQVSITVIDSLSGQPLSNATVYQFSTKALLLCRANGETKLSGIGADTIRVSYAGYFDKIIEIDRRKDLKVRLRQNIKTLSEVMIKPCIHWSKSILYSPKTDAGTFGGVVWGNMGDKARIAMYLPGKEAGSKLVSVTLDLKPGIRGNKAAAKAPIRLSFYSLDTLTMLPLDLLSSKTVLFHPHKMGAQKIDVDTLHLIIPSPGMYLALDGYQDDAYSYLVPVKMQTGNIDTVKMYGGSLDGIYSKDTWLSFYNFKTGEWIFGGGACFDKTRTHGAIWYEMTYAVCNDND